MKKPLLLAYYGDDFTGSTDALETLCLAGIKTVLFINPPTDEQLSQFQDLQAIGIAGMTRTMAPDEMEEELHPAFETLKKSGARHIHYKVCSTFDSSPNIGSIGKAIDVGAEVFQSRFVSLVVAAPSLGRFCTFGNLFARIGIGSNGQIYRLDRHPSMSRHPTTPSDESDLVLHLSRQTSKKIGLINILEIENETFQTKKTLELTVDSGSEIVLFDAMYQNQMAKIGALINGYGTERSPQFSVGSSGLGMALGNYWIEKGLIKPPTSWSDPGEASPILIVSGSCSPVTAAQIDWAISNGFEEIALDTSSIAEKEGACSFETEIETAKAFLNNGKSVIIHTSRGTDDPRLRKTNDILERKALTNSDNQPSTAQLYGTALGHIAREIARQTAIKRIVVAGGDTSSVVARTLGIQAVEMIAPISPGAPLCRAFAPGSPVDGLEVNFKGGQVGGEDYFGVVVRGRL